MAVCWECLFCEYVWACRGCMCWGVLRCYFVVLGFPIIPSFLFNIKRYATLLRVWEKKIPGHNPGPSICIQDQKIFTALEPPKQPNNPVTIALLTVLHKRLAGSSLTP